MISPFFPVTWSDTVPGLRLGAHARRPELPSPQPSDSVAIDMAAVARNGRRSSEALGNVDEEDRQARMQHRDKVRSVVGVVGIS